MTDQLFDNFLMGYWDHRYRVLKSAGVDKVLSEESLQMLKKLGGNIDKPIITVTPVCKDKLFALSYLKPDKDEHSRPTVWNHTILIPCDAILSTLKNHDLIGAFITEANGNLSAPLPPVSLDIG